MYSTHLVPKQKEPFSSTRWETIMPLVTAKESERPPERGSPFFELPRELRDLIYAELMGSEKMLVQPGTQWYSPHCVQSVYVPLFPEPQVLRVNRQMNSEYLDLISKLLRDQQLLIWLRRYPKTPPELGAWFLSLVPLLKLYGSAVIAFEWINLANSRDTTLDYVLNSIIMHLENARNFQLEAHMQSRADRFSALDPHLKGLLDYYPQRVEPITSLEAFKLYCPHELVRETDGVRRAKSIMQRKQLLPFDKIEKSFYTNWAIAQDDPSVFYYTPRDRGQLFFRRTEIWQRDTEEPKVATYQHARFEVGISSLH
ncbi:hypothetical protein NA57DRAFT_51190 [Rhizodiscina lignyota]|uniref:Uncharacterized protein n=1 Tax=Rhizodiscina lignyota TaxID=1504668 RepID=A0A9P4IQR8_9PEZI|nr:hypothetical protein NA57DRAFT_51190 [Rhizodiscina lignyota]